ncbi:MAG TPA: ABC transporter permease [Terriglobales bacterium]
MNSESNAVPRDANTVETQLASATAPVAATHPMYWSIERELWEYRSIYVAPLVVAGVALFAFLFTTLGRSLATPDLDRRLAILQEPYQFVSALIFGAGFIVGLAYCLGTLTNERRDRSILFWKSLPVSDRTTVLSKMFVGTVAIPLVAFAIVIATEWIMLLLSSLVAIGSGLRLSSLWNGALFQDWLMLLYHIVTIHMLWYAPIYAWLLLASSIAKRAAILWAALPALVIGIVEKMAFGTQHFADFLMYRVAGGPEADSMRGLPDHTMHAMPARFFSAPGLWGGLIVAGIFLAVAIRIRRYQGPM